MTNIKTPTINTILLTAISVLAISAHPASADNDGDGSNTAEEALAGTSDNDPTMRPYWDRTLHAGPTASSDFGRGVGVVGDVNGDGYGDVIISDTNDVNGGSVRVYSGIDGATLYTFNGNDLGGSPYIPVSSAGDINNDGYDDFFVAGEFGIKVYSGSTGTALYEVNGSAVSGEGDLNNDGYDDFIVGTAQNHEINIYSGLDGSVLHQNSYSDGYYGSEVDILGDINNDGYQDYATLTRPFDIVFGYQPGSISIYSGKTNATLYSFSSLQSSISKLGDVNNDGYDDFIIGHPQDNGAQGRAEVHSGKTGNILYIPNRGEASTHWGNLIADAGDLNGDGYADFIIGDDISFSLYNGKDGKSLFWWTDYRSVGAGDIDGDGYTDLIAGNFSQFVRVFLSSDLHNDLDLDFTVNSADACPLDTLGSLLDTDNDGLCDEGSDTDDDNDAWSDSDEIACGGTDPLDNSSTPEDTDGDSICNIIDDDDDNDGLPDTDEPNYNTSPLDWDTDGDGLSDGDEILLFSTNPLLPDSNNDGDGEPDWYDADDDNDGIPDSWENIYGLDPLDTNDASDDTDGDGSINYEEYLADTSPNNANERPYWWLTINGKNEDDQLGMAISNAGDVNNDGHTDFIAGAANDDNNGDESGSASVYSGADGTALYTVYGDSAGDQLGGAVSNAGDVNNDGYADFIAGAMHDDNNGSESGSARVYSGADGTALYTVYGDGPGDKLGASVSAIGDVNNDNHDDFAVGAIQSSGEGFFRVYSGMGGTILYTVYGIGDLSISDIGDINNDGYNEIIAGGTGAQSYGLIKVLSGVNGEELYSFNGGANDDLLGYSVSQISDINDDGYPEFMAGAPGRNNDSGNVRVYSGIDGSFLHIKGGPSKSRLGTSVSGIGDINGDGYDDFIAGAPDSYKHTPGSVRIYSGLNGNLLYTLNGDRNYDEFGYSVAGVGDLDSDGYTDFVVGAKGSDDNGMDSGSVRVFLSSGLMNDIDLDHIVNAADPDADSDSDGMPDMWENTYGLDPSSASDANGDLDGDGFTNLQEYNLGYNPSEIDRLIPLCDFDNDMDADILLRNSTNGSWRRFDMQGNAVNSNANMSGLYVNTSWTAQSCFDADADGDDDILLRSSSGAWRVFTVQGGVIQANANLDLYQNLDYTIQGTMDIDADGDDDIILRHKTSGKWRIFLMNNGSVSSNQGLNVYMNPSWKFAFAEDMDNDDDDDIVLRHSNGNWRKFNVDFAGGGQGSIGSNEGFNAFANTAWQFMFAGDLDADGDTDMVLRNRLNNEWKAFYTNNGNLTSNTTLDLDPSVAWQFRASGDTDGDGDSDIILRHMGDSSWRIHTIKDGVVDSDTELHNLYKSSSWTLFE